MNVQHSSRTDRWYTPIEIIHMVREVLGEIHLDPASEDSAQERIGAHRIITADAELPGTPWLVEPGNIYCNPPGGKKGNKSMTGLFWRKMIAEKEAGRLNHGIFMCFSIEALQHTQNLGCAPMAFFPICIPRRRIAFDYPDGTKGAAPSHSNAIVYVPGRTDERSRFAEVFSTTGSVVNL